MYDIHSSHTIGEVLIEAPVTYGHSSRPSRPPSQMATDSWYNTQEAPPPHAYPYPSYPSAPSYENGQYAQGSSRQPVRSPPPAQPFQHPPPTYPSQPPQHPQWNQYGVPYPPAPQQPGQPSYPPTAGAWPDLSPRTPNDDDRRYPQPPPRVEPRRTEDRPLQQPEAAPPPSAPVRKTGQKPAGPAPAPTPAPPVRAPILASQGPPPPQTPQGPPVVGAPPIGIYFAPLLESYRLIMDTATAIQYEAPSVRPPPPPEALERMCQAASYGAQVLDAAAKRVIPEPPRPPADRPPEEGEGDAAAACGVQMATQSENPLATEGQTCLGCSATSTPEWRKGPMGPRTLCNACGLVYAKLIKKPTQAGTGHDRGRNQNNAQNAGQAAHQAAMDDAGAQSSSDEDSQQDRRSDAGYHSGRQ